MTHQKAITIAQLIIDNDNLKTEKEQLKNDIINAEMNLQIMTDKYTQAMELLKLITPYIPRGCATCANWDCVSKPNIEATCKVGGCISMTRTENWRWQHADKLDELRGGKADGSKM